LNCLDSKVNQIQAFSNSFQNTLSVKQPIELKFQQVDFPLSLENISFSKELESTNLGSNFEWINKFKLHKTHTLNQQQGLQAIHLDLETSKHHVQ